MTRNADRTAEITQTVGTGTLSLSGPAVGHQSLTQAFGVTTVDVGYGISHAASGAWETGVGQFIGSSNTLVRNVVRKSSASGSKVAFASGEKVVYVTELAEGSRTFESERPGDTALTIKAVPGQTANIIEVVDADGGSPFTINSVGAVAFDRTGDVPQASFAQKIGGVAEIRPSIVGSGTGQYLAGRSGIRMRFGGTSGTQGVFQFTAGDAETITIDPNFNTIHMNGPHFFTILGVTAATIQAEGTVAPTVQTVMTREKGDLRYTQASTIRLKQSVKSARKIVDLEPVEFLWGGQMSEDDPRYGKREWGFIAEEVALNFPEAVLYDDDDGRPIGLKPVPLIAALCVRLQEAESMLADMERRLSALEDDNAH